MHRESATTYSDAISGRPAAELPPYPKSLLTPRDWASHFKNVLHRAMMVRSTTTEEACRCCGHARENLLHFATCEKAGDIFRKLHELTGTGPLRSQQEIERFALFALHPREAVAAVCARTYRLPSGVYT